MSKRLLTTFVMMVVVAIALTGCSQKKECDGAYDFIIYETDDNNSDLSDNVVVATYHIEYTGCKAVTDTLIKKGSIYFFDEEAPDYLVLKNSTYGLTYSEGYFQNFSECSNGDQIDISWSYIAVNGDMANTGIGETPLDGLTEFGFVINGWKE